MSNELEPNAQAQSLRREAGQAAFEFVLMFPVFIGLLFVLFDFGFLMYEYVSVSNATREAARYAAVNCNDGSCTAAEIQNWTVARGGGILKVNHVCTGTAPFGEPTGDADPDMICINWVNQTTGVARGSDRGRRGDPVVVTVKHRYGFLLLPVDFPVVSCAVMRLESDEDLGTVNGGSGPIGC